MTLNINVKEVSLSKYRLERAKQSLEAAKSSKDNNDWFTSNNRLYYAIFHAIRAVLALEKIDFKKHSAVISYFNKNYILTNIFDKSYGKVVNNAYEIRQKSDYEDFYVIDKIKTEDLLKNTEKFLADIDTYLQSKYKWNSAYRTNAGGYNNYNKNQQQ